MAQESNNTPSTALIRKFDKLKQRLARPSEDLHIQALPQQRNIKAIFHSIKNSNDIDLFLKVLFQLKFFKNIELIQVCFHQKSYSQAQIVSCNSHNESNEGELSATEFHQYLQSVKKSKNKFFQAGVDTFPHFHSVGTFLAKEFIFSDISFLFIISRNDFLRPTKDEYDSFYYISDLLKHKIRSLLLLQEQKYKNEVVQHIYNQLEETLQGSHQQSTPLINFYQTERLKLMADLLDTLKHELSNPLFGIRLAVENLIQFEDQDSREIQGEIINNISRSQKIIDNFVSLYDSSNIQEEFNCIDAIKEAITLSKSATAGIEKIVLPNGLEDLRISCHKTSFIQIIFNAIVNSAQAMLLSGQTVKKIEISCTDQKFLQIEIIDNGPGVDEAKIEKLFEPFFTTKEKGTGLGLSICRSLAQRINAEIDLKNNIATKGAVFRLRFRQL